MYGREHSTLPSARKPFKHHHRINCRSRSANKDWWIILCLSEKHYWVEILLKTHARQGYRIFWAIATSVSSRTTRSCLIGWKLGRAIFWNFLNKITIRWRSHTCHLFFRWKNCLIEYNYRFRFPHGCRSKPQFGLCHFRRSGSFAAVSNPLQHISTTPGTESGHATGLLWKESRNGGLKSLICDDSGHQTCVQQSMHVRM